ncbi:hypothetical protein [Embleya sp. NPDC005971]|uniref:hypothetical protein n=1 Tax=Embleya sp. NPDC005971 TaxID=3156724 RepID=UPI00340A11B9
MTRPDPTDLCTCGHARATHARTVWRCREINGYNVRCECDRFEYDAQANTLDSPDPDLDAPGTWLCPHGNRTDGTWGKCDGCDDLRISEPA